MIEIREATAADVRRHRTSAPSHHPLDELAGAIHRVAVDEGEIVGWISGYPVGPRGGAERDWLQLNGPGGRHGDALVDALVGPFRTLWADSPRPTLAPVDDRWERPAVPRGVEQTDPPFYSADDIQVLSGIEAIRCRPGMYVGDPHGRGVWTLVLEVLSNVIDEHLAGFATTVRVEYREGEWTIADDGRGIPPEAVAQVFMHLHAGSTWRGHRPHVHLGCFGVGLVVLNALTESLTVEVDREDCRVVRHFSKGLPVGGTLRSGPTGRTGTRLRFALDREIFGEPYWIPELRDRMHEIACLNPRLRVFFQGEDLSQPGGIGELARSLACGRGGALHRVALCHGGIEVDLAIATGGLAGLRTYANQLRTAAGPHVDVLKESLPSYLANGAVVCALMLQDLRFAGRTRERLDVPEAGTAVQAAVAALVASGLCD